MSGWNCPIINSLRYNPRNKKKNREALTQHYDRLERFVRGVADDSWHLIINGPAGSGKTEFCTETLMDLYDDKSLKHEPLMISGTISSVALFATLYKMRKKGQVLVVDDTDKILDDIECLEVLKACCDTKKDKQVTWRKYTSALKELGAKDTFTYRGRIILITNRRMQTEMGQSPTRWQQAVMPLFDRMEYFRAGLDTHWSVEAIKMFADPDELRFQLTCFEDENVAPDVQKKLIQWIIANQDDMRHVSFRSVYRLVKLHQKEPEHWKDLAATSLFN
jgi:hypothetical protein